MGGPLRCKYCINPQSWNTQPPYQYTPKELFDIVSVDSIYFSSTKGGLTFGGGEPLLHSLFIEEFRKLCPKTWNFWVETSLNVPYENISRVLSVFDIFVVDIKSTDLQVYKEYTTQSGLRVIDNIKKLLVDIGPEHIIVRVPIIPDIADEASQIESIAQLTEIGITQFDRFEYVVPSWFENPTC